MMKMKTVLTSLLLWITLAVQAVLSSFVIGEDTIAKQTDQAVLIVAGKITDVQSDHLYGRIYTDVTITVSKILKGKPNIDKNTVRFRVEGGTSAGETEWVSTVVDFPLGDELILFIEKRTGDDWEQFYDGLYPIMYPPYPKIRTVFNIADGKTYEIARFHLAFYKEKYSLHLPLELAFRFIENAVKAPEKVALLEEKIRPIQDDKKHRHNRQIESPEFLSMLDSELTTIEKIIKQREANDANKKNDTQ